MSRDSNERYHDSQRHQYEKLTIPMPPIPSLSEPDRAVTQYPLTDTPPVAPSIPPLVTSLALPSSLATFFAHTLPSPCYKVLYANLKPTTAVSCIQATRSIPAPTSDSDYQVQRDETVVKVDNDTCNATSNSACSGVGVGGDDANKDRDVADRVKHKRMPQVSSAIWSTAETSSIGLSLSLSQSSPAHASVTVPQTSLEPSSIFTSTNTPPSSIPGNQVTVTPPSFTSTSTPSTTTFSSTSPPTSTTTLADGITSSTATSPTTGATTTPTSSSPSLTTGATTTSTSSSPDPSSSPTSTTLKTSISMSLTTITLPTTSPLSTSISGIPTSLTVTTPPSASVPFSSITTSNSSITTSDSETITNITSFTSSSSTFTTSFNFSTFTSFSSPSSSTSFSSPTSPPWLTIVSSTSTSPPSMIYSKSFPNGVWSTMTSTKVFTSTLPNGGTTVVTTIVQSAVLSTNTALSGSRFSRNTGAVIAVAVCVTVGVIVFVFIMFFLCKRYRERKERRNRRKSRRPGLRFPAVPVAGPSTGSGGGSAMGDSSANILSASYVREWSRSRSGDVLAAGGVLDGEEDEEDVWRSPLVGEDDYDVVKGMEGAEMTTPPESRPVSGRKSSTGHQSSLSHSLGHSLAHSRSSSAPHRLGPVASVPPSMGEFGMGPVSYAAYAYPPALVGHSAYHSGTVVGSGGVGNGAPGPGGGEEQSHGFDSHGFDSSRGAFVPCGSNVPFVPYPPSPATVPDVGTGCYAPQTSNSDEIEDKSGLGQHARRRPSDSSCGHATSTSATAAAPGLASMPTSGTSGTGRSGTTGSKGSLRSTRSKKLLGFVERIRTSVPNLQVTDVVLPSRRSSKEMSSPSTAGGETRPGYDYGAVGRPHQRLVSGGLTAPPPVAFMYPGFHAAPPGVPVADLPSNLPSNGHVGTSNYYQGSIPYGNLVSPGVAIGGEGEGGVDDEDDSLRFRSGAVTNGLLDPNLSLSGGGEDGASVGGRSSLNVEGASLRDYVDYSRRIGGMVKNHVGRSTTTFDTSDQDGSTNFIPSGGPSTPG